MRKAGACFAIAVFAAIISAPAPAAAFGLRIGPFHIGLPFWFHHRHRHLYMRASNPAAQTAIGPVQQDRGAATALLYPSESLPSIFQNIFWPTYSAPWPFGYETIFTTAFAKTPAEQNPAQCQQPFDANAMIGRIRSEVSPTQDQMQLLERLGGALGAASGYLAKSCPGEIPAQPTARLKLMDSQIEELAMAIDIVRQPLQDFAQSLSKDQRARFDGPVAVAGRDQLNTTGAIAPPCGGSPTAIDWSIEQIDRTVQPAGDQRGALDDVKQTFGKAATDLQAHCPTSAPSTALGRLETIQARLDATWRAVLSIQVALVNFETKLTDDQKDRFDSMDFAAR